MNSSLSRFGSFMRPARQSALACSMRALDEETKFHSMNRCPSGSPPSAITIDRVTAFSSAGWPGAVTAAIGPEAAMACTAAIETEIDRHYDQQLQELGDEDPELTDAIRDFKAEEVEHRNRSEEHTSELQSLMR